MFAIGAASKSPSVIGRTAELLLPKEMMVTHSAVFMFVSTLCCVSENTSEAETLSNFTQNVRPVAAWQYYSILSEDTVVCCAWTATVYTGVFHKYLVLSETFLFPARIQLGLFTKRIRSGGRATPNVPLPPSSKHGCMLYRPPMGNFTARSVCPLWPKR